MEGFLLHVQGFDPILNTVGLYRVLNACHDPSEARSRAKQSGGWGKHQKNINKISYHHIILLVVHETCLRI